MGLIRLILAVILFYVLYRLIKGLVLFLFPKERVEKDRPRQADGPVERIGEELVEDAWCHTYVPITTALTLRENGRTLFFCSKECMKHYKNDRGGQE